MIIVIFCWDVEYELWEGVESIVLLMCWKSFGKLEVMILFFLEGKKSYIFVNDVWRDVFIEEIEIFNCFLGGM